MAATSLCTTTGQGDLQRLLSGTDSLPQPPPGPDQEKMPRSATCDRSQSGLEPSSSCRLLGKLVPLLATLDLLRPPQAELEVPELPAVHSSPSSSQLGPSYSSPPTSPLATQQKLSTTLPDLPFWPCSLLVQSDWPPSAGTDSGAPGASPLYHQTAPSSWTAAVDTSWSTVT